MTSVVQGPSRTHVPRCDACDYTGKPQAKRSSAEAALRGHRTSCGHRRAIRLEQIRERRTART